MNAFFSVTETGRQIFPLRELARNAGNENLNISQLDRSVVREMAAVQAQGNLETKDFRSEADKPLAGKLDSLNISREYRQVLEGRFRDMDLQLKKVYDRYGERLVCLDTRYAGTPYFSCEEGGFRVDEASDLGNPLGPGSTFFHESAHMLDWLMGKEKGLEYITSNPEFINALEADLNSALSGIMRSEGCTREEAQEKLSMELWANPYDSSCVSDVFGGLTGNRVTGAWAHSREYWAVRGREGVAREAFAEITEQMACNPEGLAYTTKMMPKTVEVYRRILAEV
ncbi:MAG: hypothetical protein K2O06_09270 [Acetatifactor sp.]|nr:hypothetical protein [Acetatifactor sp.]